MDGNLQELEEENQEVRASLGMLDGVISSDQTHDV